MSDEQIEAGFWGILELMGHVRVAGYITEEEKFGSKIGRIDIPTAEDKTVTQYFGGASIYRLTPTTEEVARGVANHNQPKPVHVYELPAGEVRLDNDAPFGRGRYEEDW